jgi:hypothetical protein
MKQFPAANQIEKAVFADRFSDGYPDSIASVLVFQIAAMVSFSRLGYDGILWYALSLLLSLGLMVVFYLIRKRVSEPLLGAVRFRTHRIQRTKRLMLASVLSLLGVVALSIVWMMALDAGNAGALVFPLGLFLLCSTLGWVLDLPRMIAYGAIAFMSGVAALVIEAAVPVRWVFPLSLVLVSVLMLVFASILFCRFLRRNRLATEAGSNA